MMRRSITFLPPPLVFRGRAGVGVRSEQMTFLEKRSWQETPTLTLTRSTRGGDEKLGPKRMMDLAEPETRP